MERFESKPFYMRIRGEYALFTDPMSKIGEKFSYMVPTYQALKGIIEANYWKPSLIYYVDEVKVMNRIASESKGIRALIVDGSADLCYYTYLVEVEYLVKFHFGWNLGREDLIQDRNEVKHQEILLRSMDRGGRRDIFLGTRECIGYIERMRAEEYERAKSFYDGQKLSFGMMFHSFLYPSEAHGTSYNNLVSNYSNITMENGIIRFERPEDCIVRNEISKFKYSEIETALSVDEEWREWMALGGEKD